MNDTSTIHRKNIIEIHGNSHVEGMRGRWGEEMDEMMAPPLSYLIAAAAATLV